MRAENRGRNGKILQMKVRLQIVHKMAYIALQKGESTNLSLVRVEMENTKNGVV